MSTLIICEKNNAAYRIANILSNSSASKRTVNRVPVFSFTSGGRDTTVVGLRGHILSLDYPDEFNIWDRIKPRELIRIDPYKKVESGAIVSVLKKVGRNSKLIIIATDFDREGELIGTEALSTIEGLAKDTIVKRARFSALTRYEIETAFDNIVDVDFNLSDSAETRQRIDLVWGATLTRFISLTSQQTGKDFLSVGRVQSPTLALLVDREREIMEFRPEPYWEITADASKRRETRPFTCIHENGRITDRAMASEIFNRVKDSNEGKVIGYKKDEKKDFPPAPFSTTTFLAAASAMGIPAPRAMDIAESLYTQGYISYPRTDNTVYPRSLSLKNILLILAKGDFKGDVEKILAQERIFPSRGRKETKDHPPIHPTDVAPRSKLGSTDWKVYELIVRRFLATVATPGVFEDSDIVLDISGERFTGKGKHYLDLGWRAYYPYFKTGETYMPVLETGETVDVSNIQRLSKKTKPPNRYSQGSLIQKMEDLGLGTKATRHEIIQKLYSRGYVEGKSPIPTIIGMAVVSALEKYAEIVTKPDMTATLEQEMDSIAEGIKKKDVVISDSREMLEKVFDVLEVHSEGIGKAIKEALAEQNVIGPCPECSKGGLAGKLTIKRSRRGKRFVGCDQYPACTHSYPLPQKGKVVSEGDICEHCKAPRVKIITRGKRPWDICINMECPGKNNANKVKKE